MDDELAVESEFVSQPAQRLRRVFHHDCRTAGSGLFVPGLIDLQLLERLCTASPLPVNFMAFPGAPTAAEAAEAGVARISHGPFPYRLAMKALKEAAQAVYGG